MQVPMVSRKEEGKQFREVTLDEADKSQDTWSWWNNFRSVGNFEKKLGLALELSADLPDSIIIDRWLGEPVKCLIIPTHLFMTNKKGFPVLSKAHQTVARQFFRQKTQIMITGALRHDNYKFYQQYMDHVWQVKIFYFYFLHGRARGYFLLRYSLDRRWIRFCSSLKAMKTSSNFHFNR